jgi:3-oxoacyl-[acyl-carrier protein] reductase
MLLSNIFRPAVLGLSKTLATENAPFNITINSLLPAAVMTNRTKTILVNVAKKQGIDLETLILENEKKIPVGRIAEPEEFSQLALFLCSDKASYITGTAISVDGGVSKSLW